MHKIEKFLWIILIRVEWHPTNWYSSDFEDSTIYPLSLHNNAVKYYNNAVKYYNNAVKYYNNTVKYYNNAVKYYNNAVKYLTTQLIITTQLNISRGRG